LDQSVPDIEPTFYGMRCNTFMREKLPAGKVAS
jgi:hypothetical protein